MSARASLRYDRDVTWSALLDGEDRARALARVEAIADELDRRAQGDPSLGFGLAGVALVHGYRARAGHDDGEDRAFGAIARALPAAAASPRSGLFDGLAGLGFAIHHLADVIGDERDVLARLDEHVLDAIGAAPATAWDLTQGVIGLGVYGLERGAAAILAAAVERLTRLAERDADGARWRTVEPEYPDGFFNLGLAHGQAGAIALLAEAHAIGTGDAALVGDAVRWLRAHERDAMPRFPMFHPEVHLGFDGILDGWCYGDPSTALVLVQAGTRLDQPAWREAGRALAHHAAARRDDELARLTIDRSLCHGAISHAHLFHRLGRALGDEALLATARRWYQRALAAPIADDAPPGLQIGLAGLALGLLAAATDVEPAWDRAFLLSGASDALR